MEDPEEKSLEQENAFLKAKIIARGGKIDDEEELDPKIENKFLKNVIGFEDAPVKPVYEIININPSDLPKESDLSDKEIVEKLNEITHLMVIKHIFLDFAADLPPRIIYRFLVDEYLNEEVVEFPEMQLHVDGCDGYCPTCFQLDYCEAKDDIWTKEEIEMERKRIEEDAKKNNTTDSTK